MYHSATWFHKESLAFQRGRRPARKKPDWINYEGHSYSAVYRGGGGGGGGFEQIKKYIGGVEGKLAGQYTRRV